MMSSDLFVRPVFSELKENNFRNCLIFKFTECVHSTKSTAVTPRSFCHRIYFDSFPTIPADDAPMDQIS